VSHFHILSIYSFLTKTAFVVQNQPIYTSEAELKHYKGFFTETQLFQKLTGLGYDIRENSREKNGLIFRFVCIDEYAHIVWADMNVALRKCDYDAGLSELRIDGTVGLMPNGYPIVHS
jgi:hypothetical protein